MLDKDRIEALCTDGMYAGVNGDQAEWDELCELAIAGLKSARPEAGRITVPLALAKWAKETLDEARTHGGSDLDGGWLFDLAESLKLITPTTVTEPCDATTCECAELADFPQECYRYTKEVHEAFDAIDSLPPQGERSK